MTYLNFEENLMLIQLFLYHYQKPIIYKLNNKFKSSPLENKTVARQKLTNLYNLNGALIFHKGFNLAE